MNKWEICIRGAILTVGVPRSPSERALCVWTSATGFQIWPPGPCQHFPAMGGEGFRNFLSKAVIGFSHIFLRADRCNSVNNKYVSVVMFFMLCSWYSAAITFQHLRYWFCNISICFPYNPYENEEVSLKFQVKRLSSKVSQLFNVVFSFLYPYFL